MLHRLIAVVAAASCIACSSPASGPPLRGVKNVRVLEAGVHVAAIAAAPSGDIWLATLNYGNGPSGVVLITPGGELKRFTRIESFNGVAVDAADIAWFTVGAGSAGQQPKLVRIDTAGRMREYALPPEGNFQGIAIGPDGVPWFANASAGEIGRISSSGAITYYGPTTEDPTAIVAGSDGNLWFSEPVGNLIGRLKPDGAIKEFTLPAKGSRPTAITLGPDGNVWFCEFAADRIGRITPSGKISEYRIPTPASFPAGIAAGGDGALWFTELTSGKIGRITRTGRISEFASPGGGYPGPIVRARDGSLWYVGNAKRDPVLGLTESSSVLVHFTPR